MKPWSSAKVAQRMKGGWDNRPPVSLPYFRNSTLFLPLSSISSIWDLRMILSEKWSPCRLKNCLKHIVLEALYLVYLGTLWFVNRLFVYLIIFKLASFNKHNLSNSSFWNVCSPWLHHKVSPATWWQQMSIVYCLNLAGICWVQIQPTKLFLRFFGNQLSYKTILHPLYYFFLPPDFTVGIHILSYFQQRKKQLKG